MTTKMKYLQATGIHRMFLNVATFSVTNRSISSIKKKINIFQHFYLIFLLRLLKNVPLSCSANFGAPSIIQSLRFNKCQLVICKTIKW
jgi:hypothetical protein